MSELTADSVTEPVEVTGLQSGVRQPASVKSSAASELSTPIEVLVF